MKIRRLITLTGFFLSSDGSSGDAYPIYKCRAEQMGGFSLKEERFVEFRPEMEFRLEPYTVVFPRLSGEVARLRSRIAKSIDPKLYETLTNNYRLTIGEKGNPFFNAARHETYLIEAIFPEIGYLVRETSSDPAKAMSYNTCDGDEILNDIFYCVEEMGLSTFVLPSARNGRFTYTQTGGWAWGLESGDSLVANGTCKVYWD